MQSAFEASGLSETWTVGYDDVEWEYLPDNDQFLDRVGTFGSTVSREASPSSPVVLPGAFDFPVAEGVTTTIEIFDTDGAFVTRLNTSDALGGHVTWDGTDAFGERARPGLYVAEVRTAEGVTTRMFLGR